MILLVFIVALWGKGLESIDYSRIYYDRNGSVLRVFLSDDEKYRIFDTIGSYPPSLIQAVILHEDKYFYSHLGFNLAALFKAAFGTYIEGERAFGASTITMQLARLHFKLNSRSIPGKISQILHALYLELFYSKQKILEAYLNLVPCGGNIEGFTAAALYYFDKPLKELTLSEQLLLVVIPQDPVNRAPDSNSLSAELLNAREILFRAWVKEHPEDSVILTELNMPVAIKCVFPFLLPHLTEYLEQQIPAKEKSVVTTIDLPLQKRCEGQLKFYLSTKQSFGVENASIMICDYTTMEVLVSIGSADYYNNNIQGQVNGTVSKRSPGSTLKPFIYALAIDQGLIISETMVKDAPTSFSEYTPDNYQSDFRGAVPAWQALVDSRNIPAITLSNRIKDPDLYDFLKSCDITGLKNRNHYGLSLVLGSAEVTMEELIKLYSLLANMGVYQKIKYRGEEKSSKPKPMISKEACFMTLKMLEKNPSPLQYRPSVSKQAPVAYKTGTSIGFKDAWSVAVFDRYVACVWVGNFDGQGNPAFLGRKIAAPLLFSIIDDILSTKTDFLQPSRPSDKVRQIEVCAVSGDLPNEHCPRTKLSWYIPGVSPIHKCKIHRQIFIDKQTGFRTDINEGPGITAVVREFWPSDLLELFKNAGLPRIVPPQYAPDDTGGIAFYQGVAPDIISPLENTSYFLRKDDEKRNKINLAAASDADSGELFWFANQLFIGKCDRGQELLWSPEPGDYTLSVLDNYGRSDSISLKVQWEQNEKLDRQ